MNLKEKITLIIASVLEKKVDELGDLSLMNLFEDLEFDSITIMQLIDKLESTFEIEFDEDDIIDSIDTFDSLVDMIQKYTYKK